MMLAALLLAEILTFSGTPSEGVAVPVPESTVFTASVWMRANDTGRERYPYPRLFQLPFGYLHVSTCGYDSGMGDLIFGVTVPKTVSSTGVSSWTFSGAVPLREWVHVAIVCDIASERGPKLYVNGVLQEGQTIRRPLPSAFVGGNAVLGNSAVGGNRPFYGDLADFSFQSRALSDEALAAMGKTAPDGKAPRLVRKTRRDELPIADISRDTFRQSVVASGADGVYQGHPTTVVADDGTIFCVWTINHGGKCGPMAKSTDGGRTWIRCDEIMPPEYKRHVNCPTLQRIPRTDGGTNLVVFSATKGGCGIVISEDSGKTWKAAPVADLSAGMPPTGLVILKDGSAALFGQKRKPGVTAGDAPTSDQSVWMSVSRDGGWTWSKMRIVASLPQKNLCEPFALRSPDGREICLLIRENRHTARSMMCFSRDEGQTWTTPVDTCWGLSGDRHEGIYLPDGRLLVCFRDRAIGSSTYGQYVGWVGSYDDLRQAKPGDFRVHLLEHVGSNYVDTGYSGVELLSDGTVLCTTYMHYRTADRSHSVVATRFRPEDLKPATPEAAK